MDCLVGLKNLWTSPEFWMISKLFKPFPSFFFREIQEGLRLRSTSQDSQQAQSDSLTDWQDRTWRLVLHDPRWDHYYYQMLAQEKLVNPDCSWWLSAWSAKPNQENIKNIKSKRHGLIQMVVGDLQIRETTETNRETRLCSHHHHQYHSHQHLNKTDQGGNAKKQC